MKRGMYAMWVRSNVISVMEAQARRPLAPWIVTMALLATVALWPFSLIWDLFDRWDARE